MTRENAISLLSQVNHILVNSNSWLENTHEPLNIAFDMAIKVLEQQPCENAISRTEAIDTITHWFSDMLETGKEEYSIDDVLNRLPPVTPTRMKGKWLSNSDFPDEIICSCCNTNYDMWFWEQGTMNYCPHCGAEMESEE